MKMFSPKKYIAILGSAMILMASFACTPAHAQNLSLNGKGGGGGVLLWCGDDINTVTKGLKKTKDESLLMIGTVVGGKQVTRIYVSLKNKTYTVIRSMTNGSHCLVDAGTSVVLGTPKPAGDPS